ncbi:N-acetyltransferase [Agrobacterium vitis]|uniref:GNAT family N-acetyltransferase n=1 Tax=Agrobacterium vitis TaxID=373 RepID=A0AAE5AY16_AGRVI|nr:N-acetyltransferase [Agrobacterium vitis]MCF1502043.1 N-acetyltransferase [Allorhizobium sp. Av2]MCM2443497.1 N-acetyltransferase [Agrobacterium vitis]MUZ61088.1 GNAT family N-acetyltransferase [Agrobacterium vitis]MVA69405.1 GNAT family N-acetyltransferase [Agrobacterium vitis]MVA90377.1 GNAT family N-acetyltransferase [Agrobacterium vitis]
MFTFTIRAESPMDIGQIRKVTEHAFSMAEHSDGTESAIIDALRSANALNLSLVAVIDGKIIGHCAFSPVKAAQYETGWMGLGPVAVSPEFQGKGVGVALIREGLEHIRRIGAKGCVVLGDPNYYRRFGFENDPAVKFKGAPPEYFMKLSLDGSSISGSIHYHEAFSAQ